MIRHGSLAVALVHRKVTLVQAARSHSQRDRWVDVLTYAPFGERYFLASTVPQARISARDILTIFPPEDVLRTPTTDIIELPPQAFQEFLELNTRTQKRNEALFDKLLR
ncbi:hypothetical protein CERSUDRAFT_112622 [Gelatoporia subvermispora B]|uniref:Uncharacterized protein n=1 Tax=Ceriporiopsis subvermispora (strain B) TaxID=914234 RepID=M2PQT7_CERS8|nr:hypothetical protein CERSUDRAFT_112622 [Gelatoporia subvermispora B]